MSKPKKNQQSDDWKEFKVHPNTKPPFPGKDFMAVINRNLVKEVHVDNMDPEGFFVTSEDGQTVHIKANGEELMKWLERPQKAGGNGN